MDVHSDIFTGQRVSLHSKGTFFWVKYLFIMITYAIIYLITVYVF